MESLNKFSQPGSQLQAPRGAVEGRGNGEAGWVGNAVKCRTLAFSWGAAAGQLWPVPPTWKSEPRTAKSFYYFFERNKNLDFYVKFLFFFLMLDTNSKRNFFFKYRVGPTKPIWAPDSVCELLACNPARGQKWVTVQCRPMDRAQGWRWAGPGENPGSTIYLLCSFKETTQAPEACFPHLYKGIIIPVTEGLRWNTACKSLHIIQMV